MAVGWFGCQGKETVATITKTPSASGSGLDSLDGQAVLTI